MEKSFSGSSIRRRNTATMSSESDLSLDNGSVTIEGGCIYDSSSHESIASLEDEEPTTSKQTEIDEKETEEADKDEASQANEQTEQEENEAEPSTELITNNADEDSSDQQSGRESRNSTESDCTGERLIIHADIETAKVLMVKGEENLKVMINAVKGNVQDAAEKFKGNIQDASTRFKGHVQDASERVQEGMQQTSDKVHVMFRNVRENASETMHGAGEKAEKIRERVIEAGRSGWYVLSHMDLPYWLRDNEFLEDSHRPPLESFKSCFKSIFKIHTETGNIWTHLIGFVAFIAAMLYMYLRPITADTPFPRDWTEKLVFGAFFAGAILCLGFSWIFHTVYCHSHNMSKIFSRLDYSGIALLIMGSFIPPLYYGFYCNKTTRLIYMVVIVSMGLLSVLVSLWSKFNTPKYRCLRAGVFLTFGCSGVVPAIHFVAAHGVAVAHRQASVGWMALMGLLYILGAVMYASRVPERFFPGRFNIWFQSHQIFHVLVVAAASVHLYGICQMAFYRFSIGTACH